MAGMKLRAERDEQGSCYPRLGSFVKECDFMPTGWGCLSWTWVVERIKIWAPGSRRMGRRKGDIST